MKHLIYFITMLGLVALLADNFQIEGIEFVGLLALGIYICWSILDKEIKDLEQRSEDMMMQRIKEDIIKNNKSAS